MASPSRLRSGLAAGAEHHAAPAGAVVVATVLWSAGNLIVGAAPLPGAQLAFYRVTLGALVYQAVFRLRGGRMRLETFRTAALGGLGFALQASMFFSALQLTTVASATVIAALQPVLLMPYTVRRLGERLDGPRIALTAVAVAGTAVVVAGSSSSGTWSPAGDLLALAATAVGCAYFVGTKKARETLGALEYQAAALPVGAVAALGGALLTGPGLEAPGIGGLLAAALMVLVPGTGHILMSWGQKHLDVTFTTTVALDVVVLSSLGAVLWFDQPLSALQGVGMAVVVGALALYVRRSVRGPDPALVEAAP